MPILSRMLGIRAFGTQLLCEQVIERALRCQSYDLNKEGLFNVEYADVFYIPFDFTAKPVVAPPQLPRLTVQIKAVTPESKRFRFTAIDNRLPLFIATFSPDPFQERDRGYADFYLLINCENFQLCD
jgi:hypothetical protein